MAEPTPQFEALVANLFQGKSTNYSIVLDWIQRHKSNENELQHILSTLIFYTECLDSKCQTIVDAIISVNWHGFQESTKSLYKNFFFALLNSQIVHTQRFIQIQVSKLKNATNEAEYDQAAQDVHSILQLLAQNQPSCKELVLRTLENQLPYITVSTLVQMRYFEQMIRTVDFIPSIRPQVLSILVERMLQIDANCPRDFVQAALETEEEMIFDMETVDGEAVPVPPSGTQKESRKQKAGEAEKKAYIERLDLMMEAFFNLIKNTCFPQGVFDWQATKKLFKELLRIFDKAILPANDCVHVQYIMFFVSSFRLNLIEGFINYCANKYQDPSMPVLHRQAALCYVGSYVSRGRFVPIKVVLSTVESMCAWANQYLDKVTHSIESLEYHAVFYSVTQAIFYIIVFRHRELFAASSEMINNWKLQRLVFSKLNPFRFISPDVARVFTEVMMTYEGFDCSRILEQNKDTPLRISEAADEFRRFLHNFFPFDPYLLVRSGVFVRPIYRLFRDLQTEDRESFTEERDNEEEMIVEFIKTIDEHHRKASSVNMNRRWEASSNENHSFCMSPSDALGWSTSPGFQ